MRKMVGESWFKKYAKLFFALILLLTVGLACLIPGLKFDYDFEKFFPNSDQETSFYFKHREIFQSDNDFLLIAIERKEGIFDLDFLNQVESCRSRLAKLKYVNFVRSVTNEKEIFLLSGGTVGRKDYFSKQSAKLSEDSTRIYKHRELLNALIAKDGKSLCIFLKHEDFLPGVKSRTLIDRVEQIVEEYKFEQVHIAGRTIGQKFYISKMGFEMVLFVSISAVLLILFLWIAFRSLWGIFLPQLVIVFSTIWVLGLMSLTGVPVNIILSILPSIMFVVAMSDVIHLVSRYLDALRSGLSKYEAIRLSLKEVGLATLLTSVTTAIGFVTLITINVQPIQTFGLVTGVGVMIAFLVTILVLPVSFYIFPSPKRILQTKEVPIWNKMLRKWFLLIMHKRKTVLIIFAIVTATFGGLTFMVQSNNYLIDDLRDDEPIKQDFNFLDKHYGGVRPVELAIEVKKPGADVWDPEVLTELDQLETYLEQKYPAKMNVSLVTYLKILNQSSHLGNPEYFKLSTRKKDIRKFKRPVKMAQKGKLYRIIVDSSERNTRISASIPDWGNIRVKKLNDKLIDFVNKEIDPKILEVRITGTAHLLDRNMSYLSNNLVLGILTSILVITIIMGIVYRSLSMVVISLIPNVIPLIVLSGLMGLFHIDLKITTAIIFTISFGIAVDDTIHFLSKMKLELSRGKSKIYALKSSYLTTGKAMILTTLILCSGFLMLLFSSFMGTFIMGFMISLTLLVALIADLSLLPVLLLLFYHPKKSKKEA